MSEKDMVDEFIEANEELMDDLAKIEELEKELIKASEIALANFGEADYYICGHCGEQYSKEQFLAHAKEWDKRQ